jgi:hypothetical protein
VRPFSEKIIPSISNAFLRIAIQLKPNTDFVKTRLGRAFTKSVLDFIEFRVLRRIPAKNLPFEPVPFDGAQGTGNDKRAEQSRSQQTSSALSAILHYEKC